MPENKKVVVTGANGFVGRHLVRELAANGYAVIAVGGQGSPAAPVEGAGTYMTVDLTDSAAVSDIDVADVFGVVHLAGLAAVGPSYEQPRRYLDTNAGMQINLLEAALKQSANPRFLLISSGAIYDPNAELPLDEASAQQPNSPYAVSKIAQETVARYYGSRGLDYMIARPFNHVGPGQAQGFIVPDLAQQIRLVRRGEQTEVRVGNLDAKRDYTDVRDIVRAYRLLLEQGRPGGVYNVCSGHAHAGHEILSGLIEASAIRPSVTVDPAKMRPVDTPVVVGSNAKLAADTGWAPAIALTATLRDVAAEFGLTS